MEDSNSLADIGDIVAGNSFDAKSKWDNGGNIGIFQSEVKP